MTRGTEQVPVITSLRDELGALRTDGEISKQFANWHRCLMASLHSIAAETPSCASLCEELKMVNYELPPEIEHGIPPELPNDLIMAQASRAYFRNQCDRAEELIKTLLLFLKGQ
jgi:hypothetical protein